LIAGYPALLPEKSKDGNAVKSKLFAVLLCLFVVETLNKLSTNQNLVMNYTWNKGIQICKTNTGHLVCKIYASNKNTLPQVISRLKQKL